MCRLVLTCYGLLTFIHLAMANIYPPEGIGHIEINGERYMPRPHEVNPDLFSEDMEWSQFPWDSNYLEDPEWYNAMGEDQIKHRRIWAVPSEQGQTEQIVQLLREFPSRGLDMMFAAAVKGKPQVIRALLRKGVNPIDIEKRDRFGTVPFHAAAFQGNLECVKVFIEEARLDVNTVDDVGGTPIMRASVGGHADIVRYLLAQDADIFARETRENAFHAFEYALYGGNLDCVDTLLQHAGERAHEFLDSRAVEVAATSDSMEIIQLIINAAGYPLPTAETTTEEVLHLSDEQKVALEAAFARAVKQGCFRVVPLLLSYLKSHSSEGLYNFSELKDSTYDSVTVGFLHAAHESGVASIADLEQLFRLVFSAEPRFASDNVRQNRNDIVHTAFILASEKGHLDVMKALLELYPELNVNYVTPRAGLQFITALYKATASDRTDVLDWLFDIFGSKLDIHMGSGKFINGPTALVATVVERRVEVIKLLLRRGGGPVDDIEAGLRPEKGQPATRVVLIANKARRAPTRMVSLDTFKQEYEREEVNDFGSLQTKSGEEVHWAVLEVGEDDLAWWDDMKPRDDDEALLEREALKPTGERWRELELQSEDV